MHWKILYYGFNDSRGCSHETKYAGSLLKLLNIKKQILPYGFQEKKVFDFNLVRHISDF